MQGVWITNGAKAAEGTKGEAFLSRFSCGFAAFVV
jgi:hypothetical protein